MNSPKRRWSPGRAAMTRRVVRLTSDEPALFDVVSYGRAGSHMPRRFSAAQVDQISRTVRRTPEVMVKVTGGGTRRGAVAAHFAYISRRGALEIETDEGERIGRPDEQKRLLDDGTWNSPPANTGGRWTAVPRDDRRNSCTTSCFPCRRRRTQTWCWPPRGNSPARNLRNIATPWFCTPTRSTRTCIWS